MACVGADFRFPLMADIYHVSSSVGNFNEIIDVWEPEHQGTACELSSDKFNSDSRYSISAKEIFFDAPLLIFGRFKEDIRKKKDGGIVPVTSVIITNVRNYCTGEPILFEGDENNIQNNIKFELRTFQPFTNPWGNIEYYKVQMFRMENQDVELQPWLP